MAGRLAAATTGVGVTLDAGLTAAVECWIKNTSGGNITITARSGTTFSGTGAGTFTLPAGKWGCFLNVQGLVIHARVFDG